MSDSNKKKYTLVIEYSDDNDQCEFIQEEMVSKTPGAVMIGELDVTDYFDTVTISALRGKIVGKT
jgi:hypothetical protein